MAVMIGSRASGVHPHSGMGIPVVMELAELADSPAGDRELDVSSPPSVLLVTGNGDTPNCSAVRGGLGALDISQSRDLLTSNIKMATKWKYNCIVCNLEFDFKSKYDRHLKTSGHLFNLDCEKLSSSGDYSLYNIPPVDEADHVPGTANAQCTSLQSHSDDESTVAGPTKLCIDAGFEQLNEEASSVENDGDDDDDEMDCDEGKPL